MKRVVAVLACLVSVLLASPTDAAEGFRAGAAVSVITPPLDGNIIGNFLPQKATEIHDDLHARCIVLDDGKTRIAMVVCEVLLLPRDVVQNVKKRIQEKAGIAPENVLLSAVHTHSATSFPWEYQRVMIERIADAVRCAVNRLRPAEAGFVTADVPEHVFCRRWFVKPEMKPTNPFGGIDKVKMWPPPGSPNLIEPAGPVDPTVSILSLREPGGRPIAVFSAYSLHYVGGVRQGDISADYFSMYCHRLGQLLQAEEQDPPFVAMMANGTSGDIASIDFRQPRPKQAPYEKMRYVANAVAAKAHAALAKANYRSDITLAVRYREPTLGARLPTAEQVAWAKDRLAKPAPPPDKVDLSHIYAQRVTSLMKEPESVAVPLQVLRIGDLIIGTIPGEPFAKIGLEFRKRCPQQPAFLVELANGSFGYIPTPEQFALGGYETWLGSGHLEEQASEKILDALFSMVAEVRDVKGK